MSYIRCKPSTVEVESFAQGKGMALMYIEIYDIDSLNDFNREYGGRLCIKECIPIALSIPEADGVMQDFKDRICYFVRVERM